MLDQHIHTNFSPDSNTTIDEYLERLNFKKYDYLVLTDHFDFYKNLEISNLDEFKNIFLNLFNTVKLIKDDRIRVGVEVGYSSNVIKETNEFLNSFDFNVVLLSIHNNDDKQIMYCNLEHSKLSEEEFIKSYIADMYEAISSSIDFDVLTHLGYVFRYIRNIDPLKYVNYFDDVLQLLAKKGIALELNSGCLRHKTMNINKFYIEIFKKFKSYGGEYVSVGSDAHHKNDYAKCFNVAFAILKKAGYDKIVQIIDRKFTLIDIPQLLTLPDQHVHTKFSPDSNVEVDEYLDLMDVMGISSLTITDHLDIVKNIDKYPEHDYFLTFDKMFECSEFIDNPKVNIGIEVGYNSTTVHTVKEFVDKHPFSSVILSVHDNDEIGYKYSVGSHPTISDDEFVKLYIKQIEAAVNSDIDYDIVAHLPFIFRYLNVDIMNYVDMFDNILKAIVSKQRILEFNTTNYYYNIKNLSMFHTKIFSKFKQFGGQYVAISSDCHTKNDYCRDFAEAARFLKSVGFDYVTVVNNREYILYTT